MPGGNFLYLVQGIWNASAQDAWNTVTVSYCRSILPLSQYEGLFGHDEEEIWFFISIHSDVLSHSILWVSWRVRLACRMSVHQAEADYTRAKARGDVTLQLLAPAECYHTQSCLFNTHWWGVQDSKYSALLYKGCLSLLYSSWLSSQIFF